MSCVRLLKNPLLLVSLLMLWAIPARGEESTEKAGESLLPSAAIPGYEEFISDILSIDILTIPVWRVTLASLVLLLGFALRMHLLAKILRPLQLLVSKTRTDLDDNLLEAIRRPLGWLINLFAIYFSLLILHIPEGLMAIAVLILKTIGTVFVAWMADKVLGVVAAYFKRKAAQTETQLDDHLIPLVKRVLRVILIAVTIITIIQQWGYNVTSLVAGLGIGGLAFALAAQSTLSNWFGSVMILTDRPFQVGDLVKSKHGDGTIVEIGLRSTKIRTFQRSIITVPNSDLATTPVENLTKIPVRNIKAEIGVVYSTTQAQMTAIIEDIRQMLADHPKIDQSFWMVHFVGFGDSSLNILVHCFTPTTQWHEWFDVRQDVLLKIMGIVEKNGSSFAFPSRSLYFENAAAVKMMGAAEQKAESPAVVS
jgi:MscS family membrane protein